MHVRLRLRYSHWVWSEAGTDMRSEIRSTVCAKEENEQ
jgi:hypothetical protein